ncbi:MAG: SDR family NAD(P)-dependent oxidoreductase [Pseudomonadales bacterium]|jgi:NAD(P)-dependent dehydrogenase (short-subunit alcohol dehydrogenase family)
MSDAGVTLITGAGSGMGRLASRRWASRGVSVAALDVNAEGLEETCEAEQLIKPHTVDVTDGDAVADAVARIERDQGPVKRVYSAAAIMPLGRILDQPREVIHRVMDINYSGVVNVAKAALPPMLERGEGDFINFASMAGWLPTLYMGAYDASKFAVVAFSEILYHENLNRGVRFACVCPPPVRTPLLNQARDTVWPKFFDQIEHLEPDTVLDAIEHALDRGEFFVFPGKGTRLGWRLRRWLPNLIWRRIHAAEGTP